jgi:hydroxyethylthiazole kinase
MLVDAYGTLEKVREKRPLVHHITNWVTIYDCANMTRAFGALPVMAHAREEVEQMVKISSALVLNIGTLTPDLIETMAQAARAANRKGIPVVLDAVGAGATDLRSESTQMLLKGARIDVLKGNAGEIGAIAGVKAEVKGVESISLEGDPAEIAARLSERLKNTTVITGKTDIVCAGGKTYIIDNGSPMMGTIVGTGCMAASIIGAFSAVEKDTAKAAAAALICYGIAGEIAAEKAKGPGTFKELFYDAAYNLKKEDITRKTRVGLQ